VIHFLAGEAMFFRLIFLDSPPIFQDQSHPQLPSLLEPIFWLPVTFSSITIGTALHFCYVESSLCTYCSSPSLTRTPYPHLSYEEKGSFDVTDHFPVKTHSSLVSSALFTTAARQAFSIIERFHFLSRLSHLS